MGDLDLNLPGMSTTHVKVKLPLCKSIFKEEYHIHITGASASAPKNQRRWPISGLQTVIVRSSFPIFTRVRDTFVVKPQQTFIIHALLRRHRWHPVVQTGSLITCHIAAA